MPAEPVASRPYFPPGYGVPSTTNGLIPWSWARERLVMALTYWLVTVRLDGRPHAMPTWGAWVHERFYCEGSPRTVYGRNIACDPRVIVHLESGDEVVVVEGEARLLDRIEGHPVDRLVAGYAKYAASKNYVPDPAGWPGAMWQVRPAMARGWRRLDHATRWTFAPEA